MLRIAVMTIASGIRRVVELSFASLCQELKSERLLERCIPASLASINRVLEKIIRKQRGYPEPCVMRSEAAFHGILYLLNDPISFIILRSFASG